jgi:hypothetical protein
VKRRDYLRNMKSKHPQGCAWCGADVPSPVTNMTTCSDVCTQMLFEGIDDGPPAFMLAYNQAKGGEAYVARKIAEYNQAYGGKRPDSGSDG